MLQSNRLILRTKLLTQLELNLSEFPVVVLLGARQVGKTTLSRMLPESGRTHHHFDLEVEADRRALSTPDLTLRSLEGLVIIDEVQRMPELFTVLRPLVDREGCSARFLLLGSASPELMRGASESLAGRACYLSVPGFSLEEVGREKLDRLWLRGGFPRSFLSGSEDVSIRWRVAFITSFLERDIPQMGLRLPAETMRRFWTMLCHIHGQQWNGSELARSLGSTEKTARRYLDILASTYVARILPPWFENIAKRQRKSPKVYVRDSGLLHALLGMNSFADLRGHPKYGASWEGFALEEMLKIFGENDAYYWGTQRGAELDLLLLRKGRRFGFEFKCSDAPGMTKSLHIALEDLDLARAFVVYPGAKRYPIHEKVEVIPISECRRELLD